MRGGPEHPAERSGVDIGADAEAQATHASTTSFAERAPGVGLSVRTLITVVVGKAVGHHHEQSP